MRWRPSAPASRRVSHTALDGKERRPHAPQARSLYSRTGRHGTSQVESQVPVANRLGGTDRSTSLRSDERSTSPEFVFHIPEWVFHFTEIRTAHAGHRAVAGGRALAGRGRRPAQRRHGAADRLPAAELGVEAAAAHPIRSPSLGDGGVVPPAGRVPRRRHLAGAVAPLRRHPKGTTGSPSAGSPWTRNSRTLHHAQRASRRRRYDLVRRAGSRKARPVR